MFANMKSSSDWKYSSLVVIAALSFGFLAGGKTAAAAQSQPSVDRIPAQTDADLPSRETYSRRSDAAEAGVPQSFTLPAGTLLTVRTTEWLSSDRNRKGDHFYAVLDQPLIVNGWVVAHRGQTVTGQVDTAQKAGRVKGTSELGIELTGLTLVDGQQAEIRTQLQKSNGGTSRGADAVAVGTTTGIGAAIGAVAGEGRGAGIGAAAGAAAGIIGVQATRGRPTVIPAETSLTFRLEEPLTITTERGQVAFKPVSQEDYEGSARSHRAHPSRDYGPAYPPRYGCAYCGGYPSPYFYPSYFYPGPVFIYSNGFRHYRHRY